ncbi:hypothetical protein [Lutispora sp.]|uniref:hypothetical protein n=1 Tax=Lutispora sp. TaxID=2828727 RepID=UPI000ED69405|nr:hypothetical protein [Lutispora sp.]MEA4963625.1 hypothetical protein [Lutispora sp.]HCJ57155.1 hypothetical protein [Clostridiaceae bacterium]
MKPDQCEEYECSSYNYGDKVRLKTDWYQKHGFPYKKGSCFKVYYQYFDWIVTNRADFHIADIELVETKAKTA